MLYADLDRSNDHRAGAVIDEAGRKLATRRVKDTRGGLDSLTQLLQGFTDSEHKDPLACIAETNQGLLIAVVQEAGFSVYPFDPKVADRRRTPSGAKTDQIDAYLLAKCGVN
jgi:hypothetical protein